jgi:alkanesulfonate monooxygenase SsuD/methylene tetrahydromethanopterin reductase-like flavin-dependent oxidoreductase (luciferase family)
MQPDTGAWAADNAMNIACVGGADRVRAITDAFRARWRARAEPKAVMPLLGMVRQIVIADSDEAARALAAPASQRWFDTFTHLSRQRGLPLPPSPSSTFEQSTQAGFSISGSAATVRRILTKQASDAGINYLLCQVAFGSLPLQASLRTASAIALEIMPHFAEASLDVVH